MIKGAIAPPIDEPLSKNAVARARSFFGNHSETALVAAGQFADSPSPSRNRNARKVVKPCAAEVTTETIEYQRTVKVSPRLVPIRSRRRPNVACPNTYAARKAITMFA